MMHRVLCCLLLVLSGASFAATVTPGRMASSFDATFSRTVNMGFGGATVTDVYPVNVGGRTVYMAGTRAMASAAMAAAMRGARLFGPAAVIGSVAGAAWCYYSEGQLMCATPQDPVAAPEGIEYRACYSSDSCNVMQWASTPQGAADELLRYHRANSPATTTCTYESKTYSYAPVTRAVVQVFGGTSYAVLQGRNVSSNGSRCGPYGDYSTFRSQAIGTKVVGVTECPALVNFHNPAYSVKGGPKVNGKCPSATLTPAGASADPYLTSAIEALPSEQQAQFFDALRDATDITSLMGPQTLSGPSTVQGQTVTTTTTGANGQPETTTRSTTYNITYEGNTYNYTTTVTTTRPTGTTTETSTPETPEEDDPCKLNPGSIGCGTMDVPNSGPMPRAEVPVSFAPDARFSGSPGACPADKSITTSIRVFTWSWQPICDLAVGIRPVVIALAAMSAAALFIGGLRSS